MPSLTTLRKSPRKVFAHYFTPYPISLDNKPADTDYYTRNYLSPSGENGKFQAVGGLLRDRPLTRSPLQGDWELADMKTEVQRASAAGLDGFTVDLLGLTGAHWRRVQTLTRAAEQVDPTFTIVPMPDMSSLPDDPNALAAAVATLGRSPAAYRLDDGRLVVSPFLAESRDVGWWTSWMNLMRDKYGITVALVPCFLNWRGNSRAFAPISYGFSNWGSRSPAANLPLANGSDAATAHAMGKLWMQPVSVQDARHSRQVFDEANNTENLRLTWEAALNGADWVQLATWNDYSESTQFAPSVNTGSTFLDISSYYLTRFKTGAWPTVVHDKAYVTHRVHPVAATPLVDLQRLTARLRPGSSPPRDTVEVLTMLAQPGSITVRVGTSTQTYTAPAGISSRLVPLKAGSVSAEVRRDGSTSTSVVSPFKVVERPPVQNLQYFAVG